MALSHMPKVGDIIYWAYHEFDGSGLCECVVTGVTENEVIAVSDDMTLTFDLENPDGVSSVWFFTKERASMWLDQQKAHYSTLTAAALASLL